LSKDWEPLAQAVGNAQLAVLARNIDLKAALASAPLPPEMQKIAPVLEKIHVAFAKIEFLPQSMALQLQVGLGDANAAKQLESIAREAYEQGLKPALVQFAALAPDLVKDVEKSLQIGSDETGAATIRLEASYPALGNALQVVLQQLLGGLMAKPEPVPVKP
jgi:23S rRNA C2498 (ribose-2'-O)-methylase RlmM